MNLLELYQTKNMYQEIYQALEAMIEVWREGFRLKTKTARKRLKDRQTKALRSSFKGKETKEKTLQRMYDDYATDLKEYESIFVYNFGGRAEEILKRVLQPYLFLPLETRVSFHYYTKGDASVGLAPAQWHSGKMTKPSTLQLTLTLKKFSMDKIRLILHGGEYHQELHNIASLIAHEMTHYNQYQHEIMTRGVDSEELLIRDRFSRKYKNSKEGDPIIAIGGHDINYFSSDIEIEAYASNVAHDLVDEMNRLNITIRQCFKSTKNRNLKVYQEIGKTRPSVLKKFLRKLIQNLDHLGVPMRDEA